MNSTSSDTGKKDLRPLVLILFALCILSVTAIRNGWLSSFSKPVSAPQKLAWCDGSVATGLYRVPADAAYPDAEEHPQAEAAPGQENKASRRPPAKLAPLFFKPIPINKADEELLITIKGIGPVLAKRIIEFRGQHGRITAIEELDEVKGIGPAKLKILKTYLVVD
ncbi:MAG: helix-hairpin-helix domain-containing protein [Deltaproteobacteria bacterium]|nr:helix-hairpin-helix domain-containing protein [Deltaproteobacteria bacterium]